MSSVVTLRRTVLASLLAILGLGAMNAGATSEPKSVPVSYGDLDLSKPSGAERLYRRISRAAQRACEEPSRGSLAQLQRFKQCYQMAVADAVRKVDAQTLTALHRAKMQRAIPS